MIRQLLMLLVATAAFADSRYIPITGSAWRLALGDVNGDGRKELICGLYQGAVSCVDPASGKTLWEQPLGGFPFGVAAADVTGDGRTEVFAACADGRLYAFAPDGKPLWTFLPNNAAKYAVAICRPAKSQPPLIVCGGMDRTVHLLSTTGKEIASYELGKALNHLAAADVDGDGGEEIIAVSTRAALCDVLRVENGQLRRAQRLKLEATPGRGRTGKGFEAYSVDTCDFDGDGRAEFIFGGNYNGGSLVRLVSSAGQTRWTSPRWDGPNTRGFERKDMFCMTLVRGAGRDVLAVTTGNLRRFSSDGKLLGEASAPIGFTDLVVDGNTLYLGSSPNGDNTLYRIDLAGDWQAAVRTLQSHGLARTMGDNLAALRRQVDAVTSKADPQQRYVIRTKPFLKDNPTTSPPVEWFRKTFPYDVLVPTAQWGDLGGSPSENKLLDHTGAVTKPNPNGHTPDQLVALARKLETSGIPTSLYIGHGCGPRITVDALGKMMEAAPNTLLRFITHEDEKPEHLPGYCTQYLTPLAAICKQQGRELVMQNKNVFWLSMPAKQEIFDGLFRDGKGRAITAATDDANSRTPEINILARMGLRQAGLIGHVSASTIMDSFSFSRMQEWEYPKHGHPFLRLLVAHTLLGADRYYIRMDCWHGSELTAMSEEGTGLFFHMLGKGLVFTPRPDQMAGLSRIGFAVHEPQKKWIEDGHNGHGVDKWEQVPELDNAVLPHNGCIWGNTPTPPHALTAVLLHKKRQFGNHIPATPYGPIAFVPVHAELKKVVGVEDWWHTDGISVWRDGGEKLTGAKAAEALRAAFEKAAEKLPFRAVGDDVFFQTVQIAPGRYRLYAIDPGWLEPAVRRINVRIQLPGEFAVRDLLSGEHIAVANRSFPLEVPAGALRILEAEKRSP
jgi:outer membrane protein assembly factor BamB